MVLPQTKYTLNEWCVDVLYIDTNKIRRQILHLLIAAASENCFLAKAIVADKSWGRMDVELNGWCEEIIVPYPAEMGSIVDGL